VQPGGEQKRECCGSPSNLEGLYTRSVSAPSRLRSHIQVGVRILVLTNVVPYPPHGGVHLRVFHLLKRIARKHDVTLGCHAWCQEEAESARGLSQFGIQTVTGLLTVGGWKHVWPGVGAALSGRPPELVQYQTPELHALLRKERFDVVQVEETLLAPYADSIPERAQTKTVLTFHNVHFVQTQRIAGNRERLIHSSLAERQCPLHAAL